MGICCSQRSAGDLSLFVSLNTDYYESDRSNNLNMSLAPIQSPKEARFGLLSDENLNTFITENSPFFFADGTDYEGRLKQLHAKEVLSDGTTC